MATAYCPVAANWFGVAESEVEEVAEESAVEAVSHSRNKSLTLS